MNRQDYQSKKNKEATDFFRKFIGWASKGKIKVVHFGWWSINNGKFSLSMTWEVEE